MTLLGKTALITGSTGGIGRATAQRLAAEGARLLLHYRSSQADADALCATLPGDGHQPVCGDLGAAGGGAALVSAALARAERIDILVNNAGVFYDHPPDSTSRKDWESAWKNTLAVNLVAPADLCFGVGRHMLANAGGRIINVSSRGAFRGEPRSPAYGASKAGLNALSQSLAQALGPFGVYVYAVAPGFVATAMAESMLDGPDGDGIRAQSPLGRVALPAEVADTIAYLAAGDTAFLTGAVIDINGASYLR